jgi:uncharacterized protein YigE (DUF2233 family)
MRQKYPQISQIVQIFFLASLLIGHLVGCQMAAPEPIPTPIMPVDAPVEPTEVSTIEETLPPVSLPTTQPTNVPTVEPTATLNPDTGWQTVQPGLERRHIFVFDAENQPRDRLTILRLDPALFDVRVAYRPGEAQSLEAWHAEKDALITINGGFFTEENYATGLTIVDGQHFGASYDDFAGMLAVSETGVEVRWLREQPVLSLSKEPFDPNEPLQYALQSFPVLVKPGGVLGFPDEDGIPARRTVIAQDENGNLLFIIAPGGSMTLHQMSQWLVNADLNLHIALNLDGGPSSGLILADSDLAISAFSPLPTVITVHKN